MAISKQVKDGYLGDLPEAIQLKVMNIHKLLVSTCKEVWEDKNYNPIRNEDWAKSAIDEFCATPTNTSQVGSVRVYKQGKRYSCMIQLSGHVVNHRNDINHELLHDFFRHVHHDMKAKVRKQFDMRLTCESEHGEPWEGFDIWTSSKIATAIWELFEDHKVKRVKPMKEGTEEDSQYERMFAELYELPVGAAMDIYELADVLIDDIELTIIESGAQLAADYLAGNFRIDSEPVVCLRKQNGIVHGDIDIVECTLNHFSKPMASILKDYVLADPTKKVYVTENGNDYTISVALESSYAEKIWRWLECYDPEYFEEKKTRKQYAQAAFKKKYNYDPKEGTIEVEGQKIPIEDRSNKKQGTTQATQVGLQLGREFWDLKKNRYRDAILQHEIGHYNMHLGGRGTQEETIIRMLALKNQVDALEKLYNDSMASDKYSDSEKKKIQRDVEAKRKLAEQSMMRLYNLINSGRTLTADQKKELDEIHKKITDRYLKSTPSTHHLNIEEIEADRYAINRTSKKDMKKAIIDTYKRQLKNPGITASRSATAKDMAHEGKWRFMAMNDDDLMSSKLYRPESAEADIVVFDPFLEANNNKPEYNTDMSEAEAKRTLRSVSQSIINDTANKKGYKVTQYTANIYANIISKNLLPIWAKGFRKLTITLDSYQSFFTFEFKVPKMTQDFVSRFIQGRETINGLIRRHPEINIKMSPRIFHTMKNPDDAFNFFRAAVKYYDSGLAKYSDKLMVEAMKLNHEMKHLISTTKLSGIITCPMQLLFVFDDVKMDNKDTFKISQEDIKTVNQFIRNIYTRYAAPEKEKKQIIEDIDKMVKALRESCDPMNENAVDLQYLPEAVEKYLFGGFDSILEAHNEKWEREHFDMDWIHRQNNPKVSYMQEKWGVKKLKKIPADLVAYITIETESIRDANDKMMISSYCLSKIEIVEWYIELLEVGSKKYIVPHSKPYLVSLRTQLLACFKRIMEVKITNPNDRPIIDIKYPKGYEG